ncbi:hypothetical protein Sjap_003195 [Stephania japonica]|uniref:protein-disulfide reductase n=1 Tax=Stephania japonica TaxID=461633 RepID=A0AAP0KQX8_9MAGN
MEQQQSTNETSLTKQGIVSSEISDFLISPSGAQVRVSDLGGKTVGLYFAANWYPQCQSFTPILADVYAQINKQVPKFEIVFVSSDEDQISFEEFYLTMPWLAIPFSDLQAKKSLTKRFRIEGIPSLVILDPSGVPIQTEGVDLIYKYGIQAFPFTPARVSELEDEEKAKHASQTLEKLLSSHGRDYLINQIGEQVPVLELVGKTVGLYFSASCPPCEKFTPRLAAVYRSLKQKNESFEIIFISIDRDKSGYLKCFQSMPWVALPFEDETTKSLLKYFNIQGIPTLIIIGPDGKTVTREGRNLVNLHLEMAYPFTEAQILLLQERLDEEAKSYPRSFHHIGHRHILNLVSASSGGGPFICCECDEQGSGWAYQCIDCGYEIHPKCVKELDMDDDEDNTVRTEDQLRA